MAGAATPEDENVSVCALALATSSSALRMPLDAATSSTLGTVTSSEIGAKSADGSKGGVA